jgi:hypothetical protein
MQIIVKTLFFKTRQLVSKYASVLFLFSLLAFNNKSFATLVSNPNQSSLIVITKGFAPSTVNVGLTFTTTGNGTTTFTLPAGLRYVPGTVTDDNGTTVIAQSNITNLAAPVFSITNATSGDVVIISVQVQADCSALVGTPSISVTGNLPSDAFSGIVSVSVNAPAITITGHTAQTFTRGQKLAVNITITNGANGPMDSLLFYIRENKATNTGNSTTDSIKVRLAGGAITDSIIIPLLRVGINAGGDTSFYLIPPAAFSGGTLDNGENIVIKRHLSIGNCPINSTNNWGTGFDETYFANYLANGVSCQSPLPIAPARFNYSNANDGVAQMSLTHTQIQAGTLCTQIISRVRVTNVGSGNLAFANYLNVGMSIVESGSGGGHSGWPMGAWLVDSATFISADPAFNGASLTESGGGIAGNSGAFFTTVNDRFTADPDGPGTVGLKDLDGDGFFDDLMPGDTVSFRIYWSPANPDMCATPAPKTAGRMWYLATGNNICGGTNSDPQNGKINISAMNGGSVTVVPLSAPSQLSNGQVGTIQSQIAYSAPSTTFVNCTTNQLNIYVPIAPGVTVQAVRVNGVSRPVTVNGAGDTARAFIANVGETYTVEFDVTITQGVTPNNYALSYVFGYVCNTNCPIRVLGCGGPIPIEVPVPALCLNGGGSISNSKIIRTTAGFTNSSGATKVNLSTMPVSQKRALPCDSVLVTATGTLVAGDSIIGGEIFYYKVSYNLYGGTDRLFNWGSGTYTINGLTSPLSSPTYEADISGSHVAIYQIGSGYPVGTVANISLIGTVQGPTALTSTLEQVSGLGNQFFALKLGKTDPTPATGDQNFACNGQALEFYVREPNGSFTAIASFGVIQTCGSSSTGISKFFNLRGNENGIDNNGLPTSNIDYFPTEVRPLVKLDSISMVFRNGAVYAPGTFGGAKDEYLLLKGVPGDGFPITTGQIRVNVGTPIVRGNRVTWFNNGSWPVTDDGYAAGFIMVANYDIPCSANTNVVWDYFYYGTKNPHGSASGKTPFARTASVGANIVKPTFTVTNTSGIQVGDQSQECFDLKLDVAYAADSLFKVPNIYIAIPGAGVIDAQSIVLNSRVVTHLGTNYTTTPNTTYSITPYAGGQVVALGNLPSGSYTLKVCATYSNCSNISVPYFVSWNCAGIPANPGVSSGCSFVSGNLIIQPVPAGIQSQLISQPANPIQLCDTLKYTVKYTSTLAADVVGGAYTVSVPSGLNITKARIRYPSNATTTEDVILSNTTGNVLIPLSSHTGLVNGLLGVNNATGTVQREAILELDFLTDCNFTSGQSFTMNATGNLPCGAPAQGNGTLNVTNTVDISGASQEYFSVFGSLGVGADSIITCEAQTVTASVTIFDNPAISGGTILLPTTDSLTITLPQGIRYIAGSYNCAGPNCFLPPTITGNKLSFPVPVGGINIPAGGNQTIPFTFAIDALGTQGCGSPGLLSLRTIHVISPVLCSTAPGGICPNGIAFSTGETDTTIVANKAVINSFAISNLYSYSSLDKYTYDGTFSIGNVPLPAGQDLQVEIFCKSGGVISTTPMSTKTISGAQPINTPINFSGFFAGICAPDSLVFKISPTTATGQDQCACGLAQEIKFAPYAIDTRDTTICNGNAVDITMLTINKNGGTTTYHATKADAEAGASPVMSTVNPSVTTKYFVRNQFNATIYAIDSITVTVNATPDLIARDTTVCLNNAVNLTTMFTANAVAGSVAYYPDYTSALAQVSPLIAATVTPGVTSKYFIRKQSALGCFDIDSVQVTVSPLPLAVTRDTAICPGNPVDLSTLIVPNAVAATLTYHATLSSANAGTLALASSTVTPMAAVTYYTRSVSTPQGCVAIDSIKILNQKPFAGADQQGVCLGAAGILTGVNPNTGIWSEQTANPAGSTLGGTASGVANITFSPIATGIYNYIYTSNGCADTVRLNVTGGLDYNDLPAPWPVAQAGIISCTNGSGVPTGANGAVWAGTGVSYESTPAGGVGLDIFDDGVTPPAATISAGTSSNFTVTMNSNVTGKTVYYGLWFDWNDNGSFTDDLDFAGNPAFYSGSGVTASPVTSIAAVIPPIGAAATYKMRLIVADVPVTATDFNGTFANGEVEDYVTLTVLPVRLQNFTVKENNCKAAVNWLSTTEDNFKQYEVEYSKDGVSFNKAGVVLPQGNNSKYNFMYTPDLGKAYFRLKMIDKDGKLSYSSVIMLNMICTDQSIEVYPNPAKDVLTVNISGYKGKVKATLFGSKGQLVTTKQFTNGKNNIVVSSLAAGIYTLSITDEAGNTSNRKVNVVR